MPNTNLGWWTEKPERETRPSQLAPIRSSVDKSEENVWLKIAVIVAVFFVFGLSLLRILSAVF